MAQITIPEVEAAIANQEAAREQALAQANFHAGCLGAWKELLARLKEPEEPKEPATIADAVMAANGAGIVRQMPKGIKTKPVETAQ